MKHLFAIVLTVLIFSAALWAVPPDKSNPSVILITLDTTRADHMGFMGSKQQLTPNLDALAQQAVIFSSAYAHVPLTTPSHATILTGCYPQYVHIHDMAEALSGSVPYLPDVLHQHGYATAAFIGGAVLDAAAGGATGFDRGFDTYDANFHKRRPGEDRYHSIERRAEEVVGHATDWLSKHPQRPVFVWVHLYDPHDPYDAPEPYKSKYASDPYSGEIAYTDAMVGRFIDVLRAQKLYENSLIAVVADHGEALGQHGEQTHGVFLYDETIHVPMLVKLPGQEKAGTRIGARTGLADLAPTVLQILGMKTPAAMQGATLVELINNAGAGKQDRPQYSESEYGKDAFGWSALHAWRAGKYLYVQAPKRELYDERTDPGESHNLAATNPGTAETMATELNRFRERTSTAGSAKPELTAKAAENLRALGYVSSAGGRSSQSGTDGPDPKDRIEFANLTHSALIEIEEDKFQEAIPKLESALKIQPESGSTYLELGGALLHESQSDKAVAAFQKAAELLPNSSSPHEKLGEAAVAAKDWPTAASEFSAAVQRAPKSSDLHAFLGSAYEKMQKLPDATAEYRKAAELDPQNFRANLFAGRLLGMKGDATAALPYLEQAVILDSSSIDAHQFLANVYRALGRMDEANREHQEAIRLRSQVKP